MVDQVLVILIKTEINPKARPVLPKNDRENELVVNMMGKSHGVWIYALRRGHNIYGQGLKVTLSLQARYFSEKRQIIIVIVA